MNLFPINESYYTEVNEAQFHAWKKDINVNYRRMHWADAIEYLNDYYGQLAVVYDPVNNKDARKFYIRTDI